MTTPRFAAKCAIVAAVLLGAASAQSGEVSAPPAIPVISIDATITSNRAPLEGAEILVLPSPATIRALGWPDAGEGPISLEGLATGTIFSGSPPPWIDAGVAPNCVVRARTDAKGRFHADVPSAEATTDNQRTHDTLPRLLVRAPGYETIDMWWWSFMADRPIEMLPHQVVHGRVLDPEGAPVAGAFVCAASIGSNGASPVELARLLPVGLLPATTVTDAQGGFEIVGARQWNKGLSVAHPDFVPQAIRFATSPDPTESLDAGTITLQRGTELIGRVVDDSGRPVPCAVVWCCPKRIRSYGYCPEVRWQPDFDDDLARRQQLGAADAVATPTDAEGRFRLRGVTVDDSRDFFDPRPLVDVQAVAADFEVGLARDIDLDEAVHPELRIVLARERRLELHVIDDASGAAIDDAEIGAFVSMWPGGWTAGSPTVQRTGAGSFLLGHAGRHETLLWIRSEGHAPSGLRVPGLAAGETRPIEVRLVAESILSGRLTDSDGGAIANSKISGRLSVPRVPHVNWGEIGATPDVLGQWSIAGVGGTVRSLHFSADGFATVTLRDVALKPGERRTLDVVLPRAASVTALWPQPWVAPGREPNWVVLSREPPGSEHSFSGADKIDRTFFRFVAPGKYRLLARGCEPMDLELVEGDEQEVQLSAKPLPRVSGRVLCGGQPVSGLCVSGFREDDPQDSRSPFTESVFSDEQGRFELLLPYAATWRVHADRQWLYWDAPPVAAAWGDSIETNIEIPANHWKLEVVDSLGQPIPNATIYFADSAGPVRSRFDADDAGRAEVEGVPPGPCHVGLMHPPVASSAPVWIEVPDADGSEPPLVRLVIPKLASVSGTIQGEADRNPRFRVRVARLDDPNHGEAFAASTSDRYVMVIGGRYDVGGLAPGPIRVFLESETGPVALSASAMGQPPQIWWPFETRDLTLAADEQATLNFAP